MSSDQVELTDRSDVESGVPDQLFDVPEPSFRERWCTESVLSNCLTFSLAVVGGLGVWLEGDGYWKFVFAVGLFGFAGGITNALAVKMLFDKIPGVYGSGIIPGRFVAIRAAFRDMVLQAFFREAQLKRFLREHGPSALEAMRLSERVGAALESPEMEAMMVSKMEALAAEPTQAGTMLNMASQMFGGVAGMAPHLKPLLVSFGKEMAGKLAAGVDFGEVDVCAVRRKLEELLEDRLQDLTADMVKELIEHVIRAHLGWLVVWGNVFGGCIGLVAQIAGYGL